MTGRNTDQVMLTVVVLASLIVLPAVGFVAGKITTDMHYAAKEAKAKLDTVQLARDTERAGQTVATATGAKVAEHATQIRVQTKEVVRYVQNIPSSIADRPLPDEFVRPVNAAITGDLSYLATGAGQPDKPATEVRTDDAALTLSEDFATCREALARAEAWPKFYDEVRRTYNGGKSK